MQILKKIISAMVAALACGVLFCSTSCLKLSNTEWKSAFDGIGIWQGDGMTVYKPTLNHSAYATLNIDGEEVPLVFKDYEMCLCQTEAFDGDYNPKPKMMWDKYLYVSTRQNGDTVNLKIEVDFLTNTGERTEDENHAVTIIEGKLKGNEYNLKKIADKTELSDYLGDVTEKAGSWKGKYDKIVKNAETGEYEVAETYELYITSDGTENGVTARAIVGERQWEFVMVKLRTRYMFAEVGALERLYEQTGLDAAHISDATYEQEFEYFYDLCYNSIIYYRPGTLVTKNSLYLTSYETPLYYGNEDFYMLSKIEVLEKVTEVEG